MLQSLHEGDISIHAPVKGATVYDSSYRDAAEISIHAPVKGATRQRQLALIVALQFQSTLP